MTTQQQPQIDSIDQLDVEIGASIANLMFRRKITQRELGRHLGIGQSTVSSKLYGHTKISLRELYEIAQLLGVSPGDLLPRLDSNQQPSGYLLSLVSDHLAEVVYLSDRRAS